MEFGQHSITFEEADRYYVELERRYNAGDISEQEFDARRRELMVLDNEGRWWSKSHRTGEWHYYDSNVWVKATPPDDPSKEPIKPSMHKPSIDDLLQICVRYDGGRYYAGDAIPSDVLARARSRFPIPPDKRVVALVGIGPMGIVGIGRQGGGIAICEDGLRLLRWRPDLPGIAKRSFLEWNDFGDVTIDLEPPHWRSMYRLEVGKGNVFLGRDKDMNHLGLAQLLREIQAAVTASTTE